jgi:hypothetical protein
MSKFIRSHRVGFTISKENFLAERMLGEAKRVQSALETPGYAIYMHEDESWPTLWAEKEEVDRMAVDFLPDDAGSPYRIIWVNDRREIVPPPEE